MTCLKKYGTNPLSYLTLSENLKDFTGEWDGFIGYKNHLKVAVILGDPNVLENDLQKAIKDLKIKCKKKRYNICFFQNKKFTIQTLWDEGFKGFCFGEDAIVNLNDFNLKGKKKWSIRSSVNYAKRNNMK